MTFRVFDTNRERVESGLATINGNMTRQVASGRLSEEKRKAALAHISAADSLSDLADADLVIESATENEEVKRQISGSSARS